jgi:hypothetical protein
MSAITSFAGVAVLTTEERYANATFPCKHPSGCHTRLTVGELYVPDDILLYATIRGTEVRRAEPLTVGEMVMYAFCRGHKYGTGDRSLREAIRQLDKVLAQNALELLDRNGSPAPSRRERYEAHVKAKQQGAGRFTLVRSEPLAEKPRPKHRLSRKERREQALERQAKKSEAKPEKKENNKKGKGQDNGKSRRHR